MEEIGIEEVIIVTLGLEKQAKIYNQVIEKYKKDYMEQFGKDLNNVEELRNCTYKLIIALAILDVKIQNYDVKFHNKKILKINIEEFIQEYKEYIDGVKEVEKKSNDVKEKLSNEFMKE